jgi:hypothetical protein
MPNVSQSRLGLLIIWGLMLGLVYVTPAASQQAPVRSMSVQLNHDFSAEVKPEKFNGAMDIRIHSQEGKLTPPADLLLKDPSGRKTGLDMRQGKAYKEIPEASYEFEELPDAKPVVANSGELPLKAGVIALKNPQSGEYTLEIIGKESGRYVIEITGYDKDKTPSKIRLESEMTSRGAVRELSFSYTNQPGVNSVCQ